MHPGGFGKYPVTNLQYARFVAGGGYGRRELWSEAGWAWRQKENREGPWTMNEEFENPIFPRISVTFYEAEAYCRWLATSKSFRLEGDSSPESAGRLVARLPAEEEWERAARGADGREYPWNGTFDVALANTEESGEEGKPGIGTTAVCTFVQAASPVSALDMSGNVLEWTGTLINNERYPLCGGCFYFDKEVVRCAARVRYDPVDFSYVAGFRVVLFLANSGS